MDKLRIEHIARQVQTELWNEHLAIRSVETSLTLAEWVNLFDPENVAHFMGINFEYHEKITPLDFRNNRSVIAGLLDRQANKIAVSQSFPHEVTRFTGAHEIGHWILHQNEVMHRDRPISGLTRDAIPRSLMEQEADYFAACLLMPRKLVRKALEASFRTTTPFEFNDATSFWLCKHDPDSLLRPADPLDRAIALASAENYQERHFVSLANRFKVSKTTMAIRLMELGLIAE